ncbi:MAG TPA: energy transducer TonB [Micropepsaceae bacterium]|nr:energy transducer TonB [Micropepsaceae bacterium]
MAFAFASSGCVGMSPEPPLAIISHAVTAADYPAESIRLHEQGATRLSYLVQADGTVGQLKILDSSGSERLDQAATELVRKWRFRPAMQNGAAVTWQEIVNVAFVLN